MVGERIQNQAQGMIEGGSTATRDVTARITDGKPLYQTAQEAWERSKARRRSLLGM